MNNTFQLINKDSYFGSGGFYHRTTIHNQSSDFEYKVLKTEDYDNGFVEGEIQECRVLKGSALIIHKSGGTGTSGDRTYKVEALTPEYIQSEIDRMDKIAASQPVEITGDEGLFYANIGQAVRIVNEYHRENRHDFDGLRYEKAVQAAMMGKPFPYQECLKVCVHA